MLRHQAVLNHSGWVGTFHGGVDSGAKNVLNDMAEEKGLRAELHWRNSEAHDS